MIFSARGVDKGTSCSRVWEKARVFCDRVVTGAAAKLLRSETELVEGIKLGLFGTSHLDGGSRSCRIGYLVVILI